MILSDEDILRTRQAIESTYDCLCDIIEYQAIRNEITKRKEYVETVVQEGKPCRKSYKTISNSNESEKESGIIQIVKLFIAPEINIKPGSKIIVTDKQENVTIYKNSGEPAKYTTHQEIILEIFKGWA